MISYAIAKYVDDQARNEPVNVGVIVFDGSRALARFDAEDDGGKLDLRRVRHPVTSRQTYRAWVDYWRTVLADPSVLDAGLGELPSGDSRVIDRLTRVPGGDFYVELGGKVVFDADARTLEDTVQDLFSRLVRQEEPPAAPTLHEKSRDALSIAGVELEDDARFKERYPITLKVQGVSVQEEVSYAVMNGGWHYLQEVSFNSDKPLLSRKEVSHCVFLFEHAGWNGKGVILYDETDVVQKTWSLVELLRQFGQTVNVADPEAAAPYLRKQLGLAS